MMASVGLCNHQNYSPRPGAKSSVKVTKADMKWYFRKQINVFWHTLEGFYTRPFPVEYQSVLSGRKFPSWVNFSESGAHKLQK